MNNPLMNIMQQGISMQTAEDGMMGMFSKVREFAGLVGRRNPQQMVRNLMRQKGIPESELQEAIKQARQIAREMGIR